MMSTHTTSIDQTIGAAIRHERLRAGIKQEDLAKALRIDRTTLSRYEAGDRGISIAVLLQIAALLQTPFTQFLPVEASQQVEQEHMPSELQTLVDTLRQHPELTPHVQEFLTLVIEQKCAVDVSV